MTDSTYLNLAIDIAEAWPNHFGGADFDRLGAMVHRFSADAAELRRRVQHRRTTPAPPPTIDELIALLRRPTSPAEAWLEINEQLDAMDLYARRRLRSAAIESLCRELPDMAKMIRSAAGETPLIKARMQQLLEADGTTYQFEIERIPG